MFQLLAPEEMVDPRVDELSVMTYLSQYPSARLQPGTPKARKAPSPIPVISAPPPESPIVVRAFGPGLVSDGGLKVGEQTEFYVQSSDGIGGNMDVVIRDPTGRSIPSANAYDPSTGRWLVKYVPEADGPHSVRKRVHVDVVAEWLRRWHMVVGSLWP